jgi:excisionase family DNA binding protein
MENQLINRKELAKRLGISMRTLHRLLKEGNPDGGDIRQIKQVKVGHRVFFNKASVNEFINGEE